MLKRVAVTFTSVVLLAAANAKALGLGEVTLDSALNQPLVARIELLQLDGVVPDQIQVRMASADDFDRLAIARPVFLDNIQLSIQSSGDNSYIQLNSAQAISEPSLSFVLETRWPAGRLLTEHTVRLDQSALAEASGAAVQRLAAVNPNTANSSAVESEAANSIAVNPDDTLWDIALAVRPDSSVTVQQTMLALQRLNREAFIADNINMVRNGQVLRIPDLAEIRTLDAGGAINEVSRQNQLFDNRLNVPLVAQPLTAQPDPASNVALNRGQLRVVTADDDAPDTDAVESASGTRSTEFDPRVSSLEDQLAVQAEEVDRVTLLNAELSERLSMLEQQIASAREIIRLRDLELTQLQQALMAATEPTEPTEPAPADPAPVVSMAAERSLPQTLLDSVIANTYLLLGVAALVILLLVFVLLRRNKGVEEEDEPLSGTADAADIKVDGATAIKEDENVQKFEQSANEEVTPATVVEVAAAETVADEQGDTPATTDVYDDLGFLDIEFSDEDLAAELEEEDALSFLSGTDEADSKLDLARAYIDMGDQEGAREILEEVVVEGTATQVEDARTLLSKL